ncbi:hypothetical protein [Streptomyces sp. S1]|uniref:hypothetical protein n=1 Tax=Streptomyces sp. S1 TaxID=718288 RepID=UPI003D758093
MTTPPPGSSTPLIAPTPEEAQALLDAKNDEEIRLLAAQMQKAGALGFDPSTHVKGTITAINYSQAPPTVSILISGDTTTVVDDVRIMNNFTPVVGQTVDIRKQGPDVVITAATASVGGTAVPAGSGWVRATLTNGTHGAANQGHVYYRLIMDHGSWKMQWRGGWNVSGTVMIDAANALDSQFCPADTDRTLIAARNTAGGAVGVHITFTSDGRVVMSGHNTTPLSATVSGDITFASLGGNGFTSLGGSHSHGYTDSYGAAGEFFFSSSTGSSGSHDHSFSFSASHDHGFLGGAHTHSVNSPSWVSFNGLEYFL